MKDNKVQEKSIKDFTSPDQLGDYIRVTSPKVWILIAVVFAIVIAFFVLCRSYTFETATPALAVVEDGKGYVIININDVVKMTAIETESKVIIDGKYYPIDDFYWYSEEEILSGKVEDNEHGMLRKFLLKEKSENTNEDSDSETEEYYLVMVFQVPSDMENGYYDGKLVMKQENAFKFLFESKEK